MQTLSLAESKLPGMDALSSAASVDRALHTGPLSDHGRHRALSHLPQVPSRRSPRLTGSGPTKSRSPDRGTVPKAPSSATCFPGRSIQPRASTSCMWHRHQAVSSFNVVTVAGARYHHWQSSRFPFKTKCATGIGSSIPQWFHAAKVKEGAGSAKKTSTPPPGHNVLRKDRGIVSDSFVKLQSDNGKNHVLQHVQRHRHARRQQLRPHGQV